MQRQTAQLVYLEYQADTPDAIGLFRSRRDAEQEAEGCRQYARKQFGWVVYGDEDEDGNDVAAWDVDVHVEEHEVIPSRPRRRRRPRARAT
jgi:hypothetical protein